MVCAAVRAGVTEASLSRWLPTATRAATSRSLASLPSTRAKVDAQTSRFPVMVRRSYLPLQGAPRRDLATRVPGSVPEQEFFNREVEVTKLTQMLRGKPQFSLITGPKNSGKTALIRRILEVESSSGTPVLHLDLRTRSFNSVAALTDSLKRHMGPWLHEAREFAKTLKLTVGTSGVNVESNPTLELEEGDSMRKLDSLFEAMQTQLPNFTVMHGTRTPILFIDEANKLGRLLEDKDGHAALQSLFDWCVRNTKQERRLHVVLASSDSFFHLWVEKFVSREFFKSYVVADLSQKEAERFWHERVVVAMQERNPELKPPSFEGAYDVCGGNMFYLMNYGADFIESDGEMEPDHFYLVNAEGRKLFDTLSISVDGDGGLSPFNQKKPPIWKREEMIKMMRLLVESKEGFLVYADVCELFRKEIVDAFIDYGVLHLRPTGELAQDLPGLPKKKSIVTAESRSSLIAMKDLLMWLEERKR